MASPLQQFEIKPLARLEVGGMDVSFTNSSLFMMIVIMAVTLVVVVLTIRSVNVCIVLFGLLFHLLIRHLAMLLDIKGSIRLGAIPWPGA